MRLKKGNLLDFGFELIRQPFEHLARSLVVHGDCSFYITYRTRPVPFEQMRQHAWGESLTAHAGMHSDLPNKKHLGTIRRLICRNETDDTVALNRYDAGLREMQIGRASCRERGER